MRKILSLLLISILVFAGCGEKTENLTWVKIYEMVDNGEFSSKVDQAIYDIGPETHPASIAVLEYYNACFSKEFEKAWGYIEKDSPFMKNKENLEKFIEVWEKSDDLFEYETPTIKGLSIGESKNGNREIEIIFGIHIKTIGVDNEYTSNGRFKMSKHAEDWKIFDFYSEIGSE